LNAFLELNKDSLVSRASERFVSLLFSHIDHFLRLTGRSVSWPRKGGGPLHVDHHSICVISGLSLELSQLRDTRKVNARKYLLKSELNPTSGREIVRLLSLLRCRR
jgi:hypothetical protein